MKNIFLFQVFFLYCPFAVLSQAKPAAPSPASGNSQSGYVYRLKYKFHIKYGVVTKTLTQIPRDGPLSKTKIINNTVTSKDTIVCADTLNTEYNYTPPSQQSITQKVINHCKLFSFISPTMSEICDTSCVTPCIGDSTHFLHTYLHIDSVSRYWYRPHNFLTHHWFLNLITFNPIFSRYRLRVSITQADSGRLQLGMYDRDFQAGVANINNRVDAINILLGKATVDSDYARPITNLDSAQKFYLQVNNKLAAGSPIVFISIPYSLTQYGAMTIPFKFRWAPPGRSIKAKSPSGSDSVVSAPSESSASINLSGYIGRKWGRTRFYFDGSKTHNTTSFMLAAFIGPTLVALNGTNTEAKDSFVVNTPSNILALSYGGAAVFEWRAIDFGLFGGADVPLTSHYGWVYRNRFWLGFGIGVNLGMFSTSTAQIQF